MKKVYDSYEDLKMWATGKIITSLVANDSYCDFNLINEEFITANFLDEDKWNRFEILYNGLLGDYSTFNGEEGIKGYIEKFAHDLELLDVYCREEFMNFYKKYAHTLRKLDVRGF